MKARLFYCLCILLCITACKQSERKYRLHKELINTLIITGQNNHNWQVSHVAMQRTLENSGLFKVDIAISPTTGEDMRTFIPDFEPYDLIIVDYNGDTWSETTMINFLDFARNGGGIVIYHAANNAFPNWKEYNEITALGGWEGRNEHSGPWTYWENNKLILDDSPGNGGSHGSQHEYILNLRKSRHPITKGLPSKWEHSTDELYDRMRGPANIKDLLYTAFSEESIGGSGREEPLIFTVNYGNARIFHIMLGHAGNTLEDNPAMQCTGFQTLLLRGSEWAATGKVTQKVPKDFPDQKTVRLRKEYR